VINTKKSGPVWGESQEIHMYGHLILKRQILGLKTLHPDIFKNAVIKRTKELSFTTETRPLMLV
jgi:hypothetical protein